MSPTAKIAAFEVRDVLRSRWLIGYALFFLVVTDALLRFGSSEKALLSLVNVVLFVTPLVTLVFATVYQYNSREFIELLLAQPVKRRQLFGGLYLGVALPLSVVFIASVGVPMIVHRSDNPVALGTLGALLGIGVALTGVFTAIAFLVVARSDDRMKGLGIAIVLWLTLALLYDGVVLLLVMIFADHALEQPLLALMTLNPIDLARVALLLRFDVSALLGYTGAVMRQFFGASAGLAITSSVLALWVAVPLVFAFRGFNRKDF
ncbi:MAG TPA: ABC transporter permease subunit [Gemmatimonadaceae bacterium]|nr:ABC transporter permease subunit [Gemmatimonadaceae bacterium]